MYDVTELALKVQRIAGELGMKVDVINLENPRLELEEHYFSPDHQHLLDLGYKPTHDIEAEIRVALNDLAQYRDRIEAKRDALIPDIRWGGGKEKVRQYLPS